MCVCKRLSVNGSSVFLFHRHTRGQRQRSARKGQIQARSGEKFGWIVFCVGTGASSYQVICPYFNFIIPLFLQPPRLAVDTTNRNKNRKDLRFDPEDIPQTIRLEFARATRRPSNPKIRTLPAPCICPSLHVAAPSHRPWVYEFSFNLFFFLASLLQKYSSPLVALWFVSTKQFPPSFSIYLLPETF